MAITLRKDETLKTIGQLEGKLGIKTKTGVVEYVVERHLGLVQGLESANEKINKLERALREIKMVIQENSHAVKSFAQMCDKINKEG